MRSEDISETLRLLCRREGVLRRVDSEGSRKRDLIEELAVSRSTVDRSLRELVDAGLVSRSGGVYRRTLAGELALEEYDRISRRLDGLMGSPSFLDGLPAESDADPVLFDGATVSEAERQSPSAPIHSFTELLERSSYVVGFASAVFPAEVETYREQLRRGELVSRMVVTDSVCERLVSQYGDAVQEGLETGRIDVRRAPDLPSYTLVVGSTTDCAEVGLVSHTSNGVRGVLRNDDPEAVEWARRRIATYWRTSEVVCPPARGDD
ncbi:helix-turn-helix transcriptional regulator [Halopelagius fulvigenes]|uniref:Helix-turn-helix transcriptional regulator n=1 Tax=Halopelagius fulvigenes TaxID=1198324 RepID=A0ABD5TXG8_9EURY